MSGGSGTVAIFRGTMVEAEMVKDLLLDRGIQARLENRYTGLLAPWLVEPGGAGAFHVVVAEGQAARAKSLIDEAHHEETDTEEGFAFPAT